MKQSHINKHTFGPQYGKRFISDASILLFQPPFNMV